jgi:hypothetical protein
MIDLELVRKNPDAYQKATGLRDLRFVFDLVDLFWKRFTMRFLCQKDHHAKASISTTNQSVDSIVLLARAIKPISQLL